MRPLIVFVLLGSAAAARAEPVAADPVAPPAIRATAPADSPHARTVRFLVGGGAGLLAASAGLALYRQSGPSAGSAGVAATVLAATGVGALCAGGLVLLVSPSGAAVQARF